MNAPQRIQRKRTKGWRMPEGAVYVGRPTKWGNPFRVGETQVRMPAINGGDWEHEGRLYKAVGAQNAYVRHLNGGDVVTWHQVEHATAEQCVEMYREYITGAGGPRLGFKHMDQSARVRANLAGLDLACWCPLDQPCHADVLLEIANGGAS